VHDPINDPAWNADAFDLVVDAVGGGVTRAKSAMAAVTPGGIFVHIGLMDSSGELDIRKITLFEVSSCSAFTAIHRCRCAGSRLKPSRSGMLGDLSWVETRPLADGAAAFDDLDNGRTAAPKIVLVP
jgi:threonine dehydrogenase-like Zn-dependent dehydrogenase